MTPLTRPSVTRRCAGPRSACTRQTGDGARDGVEQGRAGRAPVRRQQGQHPSRIPARPSSSSARVAAASGTPVSATSLRAGWRAGSAGTADRRAVGGRQRGGLAGYARARAGAGRAAARPRAPPARARPVRGGAPSRGSSRVSASRCGATSGRRGRRSSQRPSTTAVSLSQPWPGSTRSASRSRSHGPSRVAVSGITATPGSSSIEASASSVIHSPDATSSGWNRSGPVPDGLVEERVVRRGVVARSHPHPAAPAREVTPSSSSASRRAASSGLLAGQQDATGGEVVAARVDVLGVGPPVHVHPAPRVPDDDGGGGVAEVLGAHPRPRRRAPRAARARRTTRRSRPCRVILPDPVASARRGGQGEWPHAPDQRPQPRRPRRGAPGAGRDLDRRASSTCWSSAAASSAPAWPWTPSPAG